MIGSGQTVKTLPTLGSLYFVPIDSRSWRLFDRAESSSVDSAPVLVAYVDQLDADCFEVVWVDGRSGITLHATLLEALRIASAHETTVVGASSKPVPIAHHRPAPPTDPRRLASKAT